MNFKQLYVFNTTVPSSTQLQEAIEENQCSTIAAHSEYTQGYKGELSQVDNTLGLTFKTVERILPASVIKEYLEEEIARIESEEGRKVGNKEKKELKNNIIFDLTPKAFTRTRTVDMCFEEHNQILLVNQALNSRCDTATGFLIDSLGGLELKPFHTVKSPSQLMSEWLAQGEAHGNFVLNDTVTFEKETSAKIKVSKEDLTLDEVLAHNKNTCVTDLGLIWNDSISFVLSKDLSIKSIKFLELANEETIQDADDKDTLAKATQLLLVNQLTLMFCELVAELGGEIKEN